MDDKEALRTRMREVRNAIDPVLRLQKSETIHDLLSEHPRFRDASGVGLYWAAGSEVSTESLASRLSEQEQRRIFLPFVLNGELELTEWRPQDPVVTAEYGGMHPRYRRPVALEEVGVLVVPGLAFDAAGRRLGQGTGHYDRLLARLGSDTFRIGLCFAAQVVDEIPAGPGDERVDLLATEEGVRPADPGR